MDNLSPLIALGVGHPKGILVLVFVTVTLVAGTLSWLALARFRAGARLDRLLPANKPSKSGNRNSLLEREDGGWVRRVTQPFIDRGRDKGDNRAGGTRLRLIQAGFRSKGAYRNYILIRLFVCMLLPGLYLLSNLFLKMTPQVTAIVLSLLTIGYLLPSSLLILLRDARQQRIARGLPDALDLMVVCVEAGLGLDMTFKRIGDEIRPLSPDLSDEFFLTVREIRAGRSREECFRHMALRTGLGEIRTLMTVLAQTTRFGTSLAKSLRVHADAMRIKRRQVAEEKAAKAAVKLVLPLVLFIFPSILIVLAGPAFIRIWATVIPALAR